MVLFIIISSSLFSPLLLILLISTSFFKFTSSLKLSLLNIFISLLLFLLINKAISSSSDTKLFFLLFISSFKKFNSVFCFLLFKGIFAKFFLFKILWSLYFKSWISLLYCFTMFLFASIILFNFFLLSGIFSMITSNSICDIALSISLILSSVSFKVIDWTSLDCFWYNSNDSESLFSDFSKFFWYISNNALGIFLVYINFILFIFYLKYINNIWIK